jgi:nitrogen fixation protein FixH
LIGPLTGRKVAMIFAGMFACVLAPNVILAVYAVQTFSGLVVPNSYVASQEFDARRQAQEALGWTLAIDRTPGALHLAFEDGDGRVVRPATLAVTVGRPTTAAADRSLALQATGAGYGAEVDLAPGAWVVLVSATAEDGTAFEQRRALVVPAKGS